MLCTHIGYYAKHHYILALLETLIEIFFCLYRYGLYTCISPHPHQCSLTPMNVSLSSHHRPEPYALSVVHLFELYIL